MLKKIYLPLAIFVAGIAVVVLLVVSKPTPAPKTENVEPALVKVSVIPAIKETVSLSVKSQGIVQPRREIDLIAEVAGRVVSVEPFFVGGGFFAAEQVLIKIDDRDYKTAVLMAKARVAEAEYRLAEEQGMSRQAKREWRDLGNQNANDLFLRKPQLVAANANLESAKGELAKAELNLERTQIRVPFDGRIKETFVDLGEFAGIGASLARVYDSTLVEIRLPLTEQQAALVDLPLVGAAQGKQPKVTVRGVVAGKHYQWQGVLARTDAFVDDRSRMYYAVAEVANPFESGAPLLPGLFVEAEIEGREIENVLELPREALFERDSIVYLDEDNKVSRAKVQVLRKDKDLVWLTAELSDDTLVALEKQSFTPEGSKVEPLIPTALAGSANTQLTTPPPTAAALVRE
ncbi:RND family efflux transporter, MFP subunit [Alteromonadaceae bacterium Bs31]|nr:RND family efflux transporter, MFP subunit [Alteromonadaceae bacterium Bs31]